MEINCNQMEVLITFYMEGELSKTLKAKVEKHLQNCPSCRAKYNILKNVINDIKKSINYNQNDNEFTQNNNQYQMFQTNLSAYVDNELPANESIKLKKYTINNKLARKDLEDAYNIRRIMNESFKKTKLESKKDYSKHVLKQINPNKEYNFKIHPAIKFATAFILASLIVASIIFLSFII